MTLLEYRLVTLKFFSGLLNKNGDKMKKIAMSNVIAGVVRDQVPYLEEHIAQKKAIYVRITAICSYGGYEGESALYID